MVGTRVLPLVFFRSALQVPARRPDASTGEIVRRTGKSTIRLLLRKQFPQEIAGARAAFFEKPFDAFAHIIRLMSMGQFR